MWLLLTKMTCADYCFVSLLIPLLNSNRIFQRETTQAQDGRNETGCTKDGSTMCRIRRENAPCRQSILRPARRRPPSNLKEERCFISVSRVYPQTQPACWARTGWLPLITVCFFSSLPFSCLPSLPFAPAVPLLTYEDIPVTL